MVVQYIKNQNAKVHIIYFIVYFHFSISRYHDVGIFSKQTYLANLHFRDGNRTIRKTRHTRLLGK